MFTYREYASTAKALCCVALCLLFSLIGSPWSVYGGPLFGYDAAFGVVHQFENGPGDILCPDAFCTGTATPVTTTGSGQWESIFSDGKHFYGYDAGFGAVLRFDSGLDNILCPDALCTGTATPVTTTGSGQWESIFSDGKHFYGYDAGFGFVLRFHNGLDNIFCPDALCAGVASSVTTTGSGQWESLSFVPTAAAVPEPETLALLFFGLAFLLLIPGNPKGTLRGESLPIGYKHRRTCALEP